MISSHWNRCPASFTFQPVDFWSCHPGGRRIVEEAAKGLDLTEEDLADSWAVLHEYGNMLSPTVLFVLNRWDFSQLNIELMKWLQSACITSSSPTMPHVMRHMADVFCMLVLWFRPCVTGLSSVMRHSVQRGKKVTIWVWRLRSLPVLVQKPCSSNRWRRDSSQGWDYAAHVTRTQLDRIDILVWYW